MFQMIIPQTVGVLLGGPAANFLGQALNQALSMGGFGSPVALFQQLGGAFGGVVGLVRPGMGAVYLTPFQAQALPFSAQGMNPNAATNPFSILEQLTSVLKQLQSLLQGGGGSGSGTGATGSSGSIASQAIQATSSGGALEEAGSKIDSMMDEAENLAKSDKMSDQLKAQKLMMKAQMMFQAISKLMEQRKELASTAARAMVGRG